MPIYDKSGLAWVPIADVLPSRPYTYHICRKAADPFIIYIRMQPYWDYRQSRQFHVTFVHIPPSIREKAHERDSYYNRQAGLGP
jgi:hypothetical protein